MPYVDLSRYGSQASPGEGSRLARATARWATILVTRPDLEPAVRLQRQLIGTVVALAERLKAWQLSGDNVAIVIGGPDGLEAGFKKAAHERLRLSDLTLPHAMVRVLLIEQLYRAWSITINHPYHRQ